MKLYDEDGNEVEAVPKEELKKHVEDAKKEASALSTEEKQELEKLRNKDFNFKRLREKTKKEKASEEDETEETEDEPKEKPEKKEAPSRADEILAEVGKDLDEKEVAKAKYFFEKIAGNLTDPTLQYAFMQDAIRMAKNPMNMGTEVNKAIPNGGGRTTRPNEKDTRSPEAKQLARNMGVTDEDRKAYKGEWKPKYINPVKTDQT